MGHEAAVHAVVRKTGIECGRFALLAEHGLHFAIAADANLEKTTVVAAIVRSAVAVITLFGGFEDAIAAHARSRDERGGR